MKVGDSHSSGILKVDHRHSKMAKLVLDGSSAIVTLGATVIAFGGACCVCTALSCLVPRGCR